MKPQVVVVGSFVQDLTWKCAAFPHAGETVIGTFVTGPGGKGSNQAVAAGRAGAATMFIGAVGRDAFAADARRFYRANGIGARFIEKAGHATGTAAILVNASGQNEIIVALGANADLARRDIDARLLAGAKIVVTQLESNLATTAHVLKTARRAGVTTLLNPAPMRADFDPAILKHVDLLIPNETEFATLVNLLPATGRRDFTEAELRGLAPKELHALCRRVGVPTVIVTLGANGAFVSQENGYTAIPVHAVKVVDTTGAGDAFVGGFAAGFVQARGDIVAAARHGNAVAALSVTKFGTAPAMPTKAEIARFGKGVARRRL
ncbi:MAG TPA: ribokinase [Opitutaceae bacterium]